MAANRKNTSLLPNTDGTFNPAAVEERFADQPTGELTSMAGRGTTAAAGGNIAAMNEALAAGQEARARMGAANEGMMPTPQGFGRPAAQLEPVPVPKFGQRAPAAPAAPQQPTAASLPASTSSGVVPGYTRDIKLSQSPTGPTRQVMRNGFLVNEPIEPQRQATRVEMQTDEERKMERQRQLNAPRQTISGTGVSGYRAGGVPLATSSAKERTENQPNLYERMMAEEEGSPKRQQLERQFNAFPEAGRRAQEARASGMMAGTQQQQAPRGGPQAQPQPQYQPGQIVGTKDGPMMVGVDGQPMPFVEDPITGNSLPTSVGMSQEQYIRSLDEQTRSNVLDMLSSGSGVEAKRFQDIERQISVVNAAKNWTLRQKEEGRRRLRQEQDELMWSAMRDPSSKISSRAQQKKQEEMDRERENRASLAVQQQMERQRQQQTARIYADAYKRAQAELQTDPFKVVPDDQIRSRAQELFNQQMAASGMAKPQGAQAGGGLVPPQPQSGAPAVGATTAPQSGAPDSLEMGDVAIEPGSPIDFQQMPNGQLIGLIPNPDDPSSPVPVRAYNLNGRAVAVPSSQAELDMLPPGSLYILEGAYQRGEMREPKRKEGKVPGLTGAAADEPDAQEFAIEQEFQKRAEPRMKATAEYEEQQAEWNNLRQEAEARAAKELGIPLGSGGQYAWQSLGRTGTGERSAGIDAKGQWEDAVNKQMVAVATERYGEGAKKAPEWIKRSKLGDEIVMVNKPQAPQFPEDAEISERRSAREDYFRKRGTTEFRVRNERLINEARTGYTVTLRGGRPSVRVGAREYPGVRVREGGVQGVLPTIDPRGREPAQVANDALSLLTSGKPFAIDIGGRPVPFKLDRNDPRLKAMIEEPNKRISLTGNQIGSNSGVLAAKDYVNEVFGYLPQQARMHILDRMLTNPNLGGYTLARD